MRRHGTHRAAIYARVSTTEQDAEMQLVELRELAVRRGWDVASEYIDAGISGTKASRPQLDKMMADARRRKFDVILVWRFDRFARSTSHLLAALEEFRNLGVDFVSHNEAIDTSTALGRMIFTVVSAVAELERSIIIERVRSGLDRARAKGTKLGRPTGSKADMNVIGKLIEDGLSIRAVAKMLGLGIGTVHRTAQAFQKSRSISGIAAPMKKSSV
jgi:DNA invertase Pin-like site-specific DNA recombinase